MRAEHFHGGRRSGRANVRHQICQRDVGLMAHGRDGGNPDGGKRAAHDFGVEGGQVVARATSPSHHAKVQRVQAVYQRQRAGD